MAWSLLAPVHVGAGDCMTWQQAPTPLHRCLPATVIANATLGGRALEEHAQEVLQRTKEFRTGIRPFYWYGKDKILIEDLWIDHFCCSPDKPLLMGRFVPLFVQWETIMQHSKPCCSVDFKTHLAMKERLVSMLRGLLRRDVLYVTVTSDDDGPYFNAKPRIPLYPFRVWPWPMTSFPNVLTLSAGGVGHVPLPLLGPSLLGREAQEAVPLNRGGRKGLNFKFVGVAGAPTKPAEFGTEEALLWFNMNMAHALRYIVNDTLAGKGVLGEDLMYWWNNRTSDTLWLRGPPHRALDRARFWLLPRGNGRSTFLTAEAMQYGVLPVYLWDDIPWLPYRELWERGELGWHAHWRGLVPLIKSLALVDELELRRRRSAILSHSRHYTPAGVLANIEKFVTSAGARGLLRCEPFGPLNNDGVHVREPVAYGVIASKMLAAC